MPTKTWPYHHQSRCPPHHLSQPSSYDINHAYFSPTKENPHGTFANLFSISHPRRDSSRARPLLSVQHGLESAAVRPWQSRTQHDDHRGPEAVHQPYAWLVAPEIVATVTNDNAFPVSILKYEAPLDPLVLALGKLQITPAGADAPLDLPKIAVRRVWPPTRDQLVTLEPGESQQNPVQLREQVVPPSDLTGEVSIQLKGRWQAVWSKRKEDIDDSSLENPNVSPEVEHGEYATGKLKVHF
uniref:Uncharacterized protein n=1 Tax=Bionectria ochroleuca TaxID=29856 RepID=A0A8H7N2Z1_BIOOC